MEELKIKLHSISINQKLILYLYKKQKWTQ